jgi:hypothetical protein
MTPDERAELVEDIKKSAVKRRQIAERAELDAQFDVVAAWHELIDIEKGILRVLAKAADGE